MAGEKAEDGTATDPLKILLDGLETVWREDPMMGLSCTRTFIKLCMVSIERDGGVATLELAAMLPNKRTNVTRHLQYLRTVGWVRTEKDPADLRRDLNSPEEAGLEVYRRLSSWPREQVRGAADEPETWR